MRMTLGAILISVFLILGGTAFAADQNQVPEILASLSNTQSVITLNDQSMEQIEGTFFWRGHPGLKASICGFLKDPVGIINFHLEALGHPSLKDSIIGFKQNPKGTIRLHLGSWWCRAR